MPIKNYTTEIAEERTVGEIQGLLAAKGARSIQINYDDQGRPEAVSFIVIFDKVPIPFQLPCNFEGVFKALAAGYRNPDARRRFQNNPNSKPRARRIAWRIIKDWVEAQIALIEADQATMAQVFLPYATVGDGAQRLTMYDRFLEQVNTQHKLTSGG